MHHDPTPLRSGALMRILDLLDYGVMVADVFGRVRFANRAALRDCAAHPSLRLLGGEVHARRDDEERTLRKALAAARAGRRTLLTFRTGDALISLAVVPLDDLTPGSDDALLVLGRRQACEPLSVELFAREHRLTVAETTVLRRLSSGLPPGEIAQEAGVALSTVRTHISSIRSKIGTRSVAELVRLVTALPPIVPVVAAL